MRIRKFYPILFSVVVVFLIRFFLSFLPSFGVDMGTWLGWAGRVSSLGFAKFYTDQSWTQYTPGFMYYLWAIGKAGLVQELAIKIPALLADISVGVLIYSLIKKVNFRLALASFFLYTLNPVVIFDGSVWGQIDGILTLFLFLSAYYLIEKKSFTWSVFFWSVAFLIKPQAIAILPAFLMVIVLKKIKWREIFVAMGTGLLTIFFLSLPFFPKDPFFGLPKLVVSMSADYSYTSVNAFNIWSWVGFWKPDSTIFLGLSLATWGTILLGVSILFALYIFRNKLTQKYNWYLLYAILSLCFFVFPTKVHERYLFPFFAFLLTSAGLTKSVNLFAVYIISSITSFLNLYYPYSYYYPGNLRSDFLYNLSQGLAKIIGFLFLATYTALLYWEKIPKTNLSLLMNSFNKSWRKKKIPSIQIKLPKISITRERAKLFLILILMFAFVSRIFDLWSPKNEYFDEVYHAFTARVMLHGDTKAWEWWNTPPAGFAYEWTHTPLAKLGMVAGMLIFGENSFGWRIPGALLGVGSVLLTYLLAKELFKDEVTGLLAAAILSLDGLALVMSRIGMNDSYVLFFALLSIYLFTKQKDFASSLSFGLALASKWSAIWVIPILFILWLWRKNRFNVSMFIYFLLLPITVYLLAYLPMFFDLVGNAGTNVVVSYRPSRHPSLHIFLVELAASYTANLSIH